MRVCALRNTTKQRRTPSKKQHTRARTLATTGWYHDHALHITAENAYHGLAGFHLISNKTLYGGLGEPWNLEHMEERVMMLQDKVIDAECQLLLDHGGAHKNNL